MTAGSEELDEDMHEPSEEEKTWSKEDAEYFAMSDEEKCK